MAFSQTNKYTFERCMYVWNLLQCTDSGQEKNAFSKQKFAWWKPAPFYLPAILFLKYINLIVSNPKRLSDPSAFKGRTWNKENQSFSNNSYLHSASYSESSKEHSNLYERSTVIKPVREQNSVIGQSKAYSTEEIQSGGSSIQWHMPALRSNNWESL